MIDLELECVDCKRDFYVTAEDQIFFLKQRYNIPKRCWDCRQERKQKKQKIAQKAVRKVNNK